MDADPTAESATFLARAEALVAEHAELFRAPVRQTSLRAVNLSHGPGQRSPAPRPPRSPRGQLKLPLRPTMRR
jgi:hypothetical protein